MRKIRTHFPDKGEKKYIECPWCGQKVLYARRAGHRCFRLYMSEIKRNVQQMNRTEG